LSSGPSKNSGHDFSATFYLIPLGGCDMVLGVDWLRGVGSSPLGL
jgi:hypothetical protein